MQKEKRFEIVYQEGGFMLSLIHISEPTRP